MSTKHPDFGAKLARLEQAVGFLHPGEFSNKALAFLLGCTEATMSRKKIGEIPVGDGDLSRLTAAFLAPFDVTPEVWRESLAVFAATMDRVRVTAYEMNSRNRALGTLIELAARPGAPAVGLGLQDRNGKNLEPQDRWSDVTRGIGTDDNDPKPLIVLTKGQIVRVPVTVPSDGHLVVVNETLGGPLTCLMPSLYAPPVAVAAGAVEIPPRHRNSQIAGLPVGGAAVPNRLIAIWFGRSPQLPFRLHRPTTFDPASEKPFRILDEEFGSLAAMAKAAAEDRHPVAVAMLGYDVRAGA